MAMISTKWIENGAVTADKLATNSVTTIKIVDANVTLAKLELSSVAGQVIVTNASKVPTYVTLSGDVTVNDSGVMAIASGVIVNADVNASAAIAESKLSLDYSTSGLNTAITNHTGNTSNPHSVTKTQVGLGNVDNVQQLPMSYLDTDAALTADSDSKVASQKATKAYADTKIPLSQKGAASGVATLDAGGKVPVTQLPNSVMEFKGSFDPASATFTDAAGNAGDVWLCTTPGSYDAGSGSITYASGDWAVHNGTIFQKSLNSNAVVSVNGYTGTVVLSTSDVAEGTNLYYTSSRFNTAFSGKSTTDLSEGTNLYFTDERAQDAVGGMIADTTTIDLTYTDATPELKADVKADSLTNSHINASAAIVESKLSLDYSTSGLNTAITNHTGNTSNPHSVTKTQVGLGNVDNIQQLPLSYLDTDGTMAANSDVKVASQKATRTYVAAQIAAIPAAAQSRKEVKVLSATDISNGYIDLALAAANAASIHVVPKNGPEQFITDDFTVSLTGGAGGVTRITFAGDLLANAAENDKLQISYMA